MERSVERITSDRDGENDSAEEREPHLCLPDVLAPHRWWLRTYPFRHIVAQNVFTAQMYQTLEQAFQELLSRGFGDPTSSTQFARSLKGHDFYTYSFTPETTGPLSIFLSRQWHDLVAALLGLKATGDINGGLHHHPVGSAYGRLHNDLNPGWFLDSPRPDGVNVSDTRRCSYQHGVVYGTGAPARETVRSASMIFYLNNPTWSREDGGETGLYPSASSPVDGPAEVVPPVNNSLLIFECTPFSYHAFMTNRRHPRNSVILWLHRLKAEAVARWGEESIVYWPKR